VFSLPSPAERNNALSPVSVWKTQSRKRAIALLQKSVAAPGPKSCEPTLNAGYIPSQKRTRYQRLYRMTIVVCKKKLTKVPRGNAILRGWSMQVPSPGNEALAGLDCPDQAQVTFGSTIFSISYQGLLQVCNSKGEAQR
jgi:hypothetical protein